MKQANLSMYAQVAYMLTMGTGFLLMPQLILPIFGFDAPTDVWIRVLGILAIVFAGYYWVSIQHQLLPFYRASVWGRYLFCAGLVALTALKLAQAPLYLFAAIETALAAWTHLSLRKAKMI